jgi:enolase
VGESLVWKDGWGIGAANARCGVSVANARAAAMMSLDFIKWFGIALLA